MSELPKFVVDHLRNAQPIGEHPDADLLTAFAEQSLGERERTSVLLHLSTCPDCREMTTLVMGREPAEVLVHAATAAHSSSVAPSERIELAATAGKAYREVTPRSWFRWPFSSPALRWVAAAACVVVVSAAVLMNKRPAQKQTPGLTSDAITLSDERTPTTSTTPQSPAADRRLREELQEQRESSTFAKRRSAPPLSQPGEEKDREIMFARR